MLVGAGRTTAGRRSLSRRLGQCSRQGSSVYARRIDSELPDLPDKLRRSAYVAGNGELAWPRREAVAAAQWLAANNYGILGGEIWEMLGNGRWQGMIPSARGPVPFVWGWETKPDWQDAEPWSAYVQRGVNQAVEALERHPEAEAAPEVIPRLRYNLTYCREREFPRNNG